jgi:hypothetical protein
MVVKKLGIGALLAVALGVSARAATVSCMVIETGVQEESPAADSSRLWESALLDVFFEAGHIVSNAPIARAAEKPRESLPEEARAPLNEALEGGAEFFVVAALDYQDPPGTGDPQPRSVSLRIFKTAPYRVVYSRDYSGRDLHAAGKDETSGAMDLARALATYLRDQ